VPADVLSRGGLGALALTIVLLAASCGGGGGGSGHPIKIAFITDCAPPFGSGSERESTVAGAELPFLQRGAKLRGADPLRGVTSATVAGRRVQLLLGCEDYGNFATLIGALGRFVEREGADIVVGPDNQDEGLVIKDYARKHHGITFSTTSGEQSTTLDHPAGNLFRFLPDAAQGSAGLGAYAYRTLGWRNAVTVGEDDPAGWAEVAGFKAEFCSLGGRIVKQSWPTDKVARIPTRGVDGVVFPSDLMSARDFMNAHPRLGERLLVNMDPSARALWGPLTEQMLGLVGVSMWPLRPTPATRRFATAAKSAFPDLHGRPDFYSYDAMEPVLEALQKVQGDLSHGERPFQKALAGLRFRAPNGVTSLDARRQAIAPIYLGRVEKNPHGKLVVRQIAVLPNVEQTFGGYFTPATSPPGRTHPKCKRWKPPAWVNSVPTTR
jgi:branched-chain amino acid transport system substrate-binding protein